MDNLWIIEDLLIFFGVLLYPIVTGFFVQHLNRRDKERNKTDEKQDALCVMERTNTRWNITKVWEHASERGYITPQELDYVKCAFRSYKALGGNYTAEDFVNACENMKIGQLKNKIPYEAEKKMKQNIKED